MKVNPLWTHQYGTRPIHCTIDTIVLHTMYHPESDDYFCPLKCKQWLDQVGVSTHYIIDREGHIWQTVLEKDMAWHAGQSQMPYSHDNRSAVNHFSLGIELLATETSGIELVQYQSLVNVVSDIMMRRHITTIVGHNDIAPHRKTDPWGFNRDYFAQILAAKNLAHLVFQEQLG